MIREVALFTADVGSAAMARKQGSIVSRIPPKTLIPAADEGLKLNGALVAHFNGRDLEFENVPTMSDRQWDDFLGARFPPQTWRRWFGKTANTIYSVVVVEVDETPAPVLAAAVMDTFELHLRSVVRVEPGGATYAASMYSHLLEAMVIAFLAKAAFVDRNWQIDVKGILRRWLPSNLCQPFFEGNLTLIEAVRTEMAERARHHYQGGELGAQFCDLEAAIGESNPDPFSGGGAFQQRESTLSRDTSPQIAPQPHSEVAGALIATPSTASRTGTNGRGDTLETAHARNGENLQPQCRRKKRARPCRYLAKCRRQLRWLSHSAAQSPHWGFIACRKLAMKSRNV